MITTKQVRKVIKANLPCNASMRSVYTNKNPSSTSNVRRVKCYYTPVIFSALQSAFGSAVRISTYPVYHTQKAIIVDCFKA